MANMPRRIHRGSVPLEYAGLVAIATAAFLGMSVYSVRALCGKWKGIGDQFGHGRQYEPHDDPDTAGDDRTTCSDAHGNHINRANCNQR